MNKNNPYLHSRKDIPITQKPVYRASKRPRYSTIVLLIVGAIFLIFGREWFSKLLGVLILLVTVYSYRNVKDEYTLDIYSDFIVVYHDYNSETCDIIRWDQIKEWRIAAGNINPDTIILLLEDGMQLQIPTYSGYGISTQFNKKIRDKYISDLPEGEKFHFRDILDMFKRKK